MIHIQAGGYLKLGQVIAALGTKDAKAAVRRSLTRAITTVAAQSAKEIRQRKLVKMNASEIKRAFTIKSNTRGAISGMYASMRVSERAIPLGRFWSRKVRPPVGAARKTVALKHSAAVNPLYAAQVRVFGKVQLAGKGKAFIVSKNGGNLIFQREGKSRLPLKKLFGPSVSDMFRLTDLGKDMQNVASERFNTTLEAELKYRIEKLSGKPLR